MTTDSRSSAVGWSSTTGSRPAGSRSRTGGSPRSTSMTAAPAPDGPYIAPGFVDVHVHGWGGHDAMGDAAALDGMARAPAPARRHVLPADGGHRAAADARGLRRARPRAGCPDAPDDGAEPLGFNLEGPFLARAPRGAHDPALLRAPADVAAADARAAARRPAADHDRPGAAGRARAHRLARGGGRRGARSATRRRRSTRRAPATRPARTLHDPPVQRDVRRRPPGAGPRRRGAHSTTRPSSSSSPTASTSTRRCGRSSRG